MKLNKKSDIRLKSFLNKRRKAGLSALGIGAVLIIVTFYTNYGIYHICKTLSIIFWLIAVYLIFVPPLLVKKVLKAVERIMLTFTRKLLNKVERILRVITKIAVNVEKAIHVITMFLISMVRKIKEKFSFGTGGLFNGIRMAKGYIDIKEKITSNKRKASRKKRKKYKDMDNIEKVRFFYEKKVTGAKKSGIKVEESMTPKETGSMLVLCRYMKNESMELIDKYNFARYDDEAIITDDMVERVKKL